MDLMTLGSPDRSFGMDSMSCGTNSYWSSDGPVATAYDSPPSKTRGPAYYGRIARDTTRYRDGKNPFSFISELMLVQPASEDSMEPLEVRNPIMDPLPQQAVSTHLWEVAGTTANIAAHRPPRRAPDLPLEVFRCVLRCLDFQSYLSLRLSCQCWSDLITYLRPLRLPPAYHNVQKMYRCLPLVCFNILRHTCSLWMLASLEYSILKLMIRRGGWWAAFNADLDLLSPRDFQPRREVLLMSKRLAIECSLKPDGIGSGMKKLTSSKNLIQKDIVDRSSTEYSYQGGLALSSVTDFSELTEGYGINKTKGGRSFHFTVSGCGRFVLVMNGNIIYVYSMVSDLSSQDGADHLVPLTTVICPRHVVAVSMDTSSQRYTIGALLDDRMGIECDLSTVQTSNSVPPTSPTITSNISSIPIELGPRRTYRDLCSKDDPPIFVAICPQRRFIAFGSKGGMELHWVDAVTGNDCKRWFRLTAPSTFLYFLLPKQEIGPAEKLTFSSAGFSDQYRGSEPNKRLRDKLDHYRAVPLSDGLHVLFTDPKSAHLCLGVVESLGRRTNLIRRFVFIGPKDEIDSVSSLGDGRAIRKEIRRERPSVYAAGQDLHWGVRVVASFGSKIWLFCVPPDFLARGVQGGEYCHAPHDPVELSGVEIGQVEDLMTIAVDSSKGSLTVWAFSSSGMAYAWNVDDGAKNGVKQRIVLGNGLLVDRHDADGDIIMRDAPPLRINSETRVGLDGPISTTGQGDQIPSYSLFQDSFVNAGAGFDSIDVDEGYCSDDHTAEIEDGNIVGSERLGDSS